MRAVLTLATAAIGLMTLALPAEAQCYRKVGKACRAGFATGLGAGCKGRCVAPAKASPASTTPVTAPQQPKPHQIISPVS